VRLFFKQEDKQRSLSEGIFQADGQGRLCATEQTSSNPFGLHRGIDIPENFEAKGFVEPYCFYCVICSQRLNYWETLQLHLNQCMGKHEHSKKVLRWQASAEHA
jgi:hypothetical protein